MSRNLVGEGYFWAVDFDRNAREGNFCYCPGLNDINLVSPHVAVKRNKKTSCGHSITHDDEKKAGEIKFL